MALKKHTIGLLSLNLSVLMLAGCGGSSSSSSNDEPKTNTGSERFSSFTASQTNGGGELLIDKTANLTWINGAQVDTHRDGCVSPANVGRFEPSEAKQYCIDQTYGGFNDWRVPTTEELSTLLIQAESTNTTLNYLNPACPALVSENAIVRTANANGAVGSTATGGTLGSSLSDLPSGVNAGVRCVRDGTATAPESMRFQFTRAADTDRSGRTLIDTTTNLQWINQTTVDSSGDGCVSPMAVGPTEPAQADSRCNLQNFAGHSDWRAPTSAELAEIITATASVDGVALKYINPMCPAVVGTDGIVRTENANAAVGTTTQAGGSLGTSLSQLPTGAGAGVRCVRNINTPS